MDWSSSLPWGQVPPESCSPPSLIRYEIAPYDIGRLDGHARNFALLAFVLALSARLAAVRLRWRFAAVAAIFLLLVWPTVSAPARQLGLAAGKGVQLSNAEPEDREFDDWYWWMGRYALLRFPSEPHRHLDPRAHGTRCQDFIAHALCDDCRDR